MKKFIPYIFITAFIGAFLAISFSLSFSGISSVVNTAEAQQTTDDKVGHKVPDDTSGDTSKKGPSWIGNLYSVASGALWGAGSFFTNPIGYVISTIFELVFFVTAKLLALSAILLDTVILFTVTNFKFNIDRIGVINVGYKMILNLTNMVFIFILLYMAIKMILGEGGDVKKLLAKVVIVALFVNFSLFMTKAIIDISNIFSLGFLNAMKTEIAIGPKGEPVVERGSVATAWMSGLRLQTIAYNPNSEIAKLTKGITYYDVSMNFLGGSALNLVTAFVFFAVSFLFITRFVALLFYMIFSPAAFLGYIAPELKEYSSRWWKGFQSQVIFAPAFLMMAYLVSEISKSSILMPKDRNDTFYTAIQSSFTSGFGIVLNYAILIALMIGGLITAKAMAAQGSAGMVAYADKARGWMQGVAGRNTIGRAAYLAGNSTYMSNLIDKSPIIGSIVKKQFDNVANRKFGKESGKGYTDTLKEGTKQKQKIADFVDSKKIGKTDELIWNEEDANAERLRAVNVIKERLKIPKDEESKTKKVILETNTEIEAIEKSILESTKKYEDLEKALLGQTPTQAEKVAIDTAKMDVARDEAKLEDANKNKTREGLKLKNIQASMLVDNTEVTRLNDEMKQSTEKIDSLGQIAKDARGALKSNYTKSLPFRSWGAEFGFLDKIFPSYVEAAENIRKGKSRAKDIEKIMKEIAAEEKEKEEKAKTGP